MECPGIVVFQADRRDGTILDRAHLEHGERACPALLLVGGHEQPACVAIGPSPSGVRRVDRLAEEVARTEAVGLSETAASVERNHSVPPLRFAGGLNEVRVAMAAPVCRAAHHRKLVAPFHQYLVPDAPSVDVDHHAANLAWM